MLLPGENKKYKRVPLLNEQWHFPNDYELKKIYLIPLKDNIQNYDRVIRLGRRRYCCVVNEFC